MTIPRWSTIGLFAAVVMQLILSWLQAKKTGRSFREAVLPSALLASGVSIIFLREFLATFLYGSRPVSRLLFLLPFCLSLGLQRSG